MARLREAAEGYVGDTSLSRGRQRLGISSTERKLLDVLDRLGPSTAGELATQTGLTTGAITGIVDRLVRAGYARREPNRATAAA